MTRLVTNPTAPFKIVIAGGGSAGWMAAAALSKAYTKADITLVESEAIGTVGVGEATIPPIRLFNQFLGIDEHTFVRETKATYKLGIRFNHWGQQGDSYIHAFGDFGQSLGLLPFYQYWLRAHLSGEGSSLWDYGLNSVAADQNRAGDLPGVKGTRLGGLGKAYHFDAGLYAAFLRRLSERQGVTRVEGEIGGVETNGEQGAIKALKLKDGRVLSGDFFVDCTGFRGLLIGETLGIAYQDWSHWLPCDRAVALPCERTEPLLPYTQATAHSAGWQWRIPLHHRTGNGHVYCSAHVEPEAALETLMRHLDGAPLGTPKHLRFQTGCRTAFWAKNCVALGLAAGFMEPLESTSLHLIQSGVMRLITLLPGQRAARDLTALAKVFNQQTAVEYERIRDFLILHYKANQRDDTPFWRDCREMAVPQSLADKIDAFKRNASLFREQDELFQEVGWLQVLLGQNIVPDSYNPLADELSDAQLTDFLRSLKTVVAREVARLPSHDRYVRQVAGAMPETLAI
ncbi:MAG: tryptophan halogenase family protein [Pseudomonadota bacterium]